MKKLLFIITISISFSFASNISPQYLFHWLTANSLTRLAKTTSFKTLGLKRIDQNSIIGQEFPSLINQAALFTWCHPVGGIGSYPPELYAGKDPHLARLIAMKIKKNPRVLKLSKNTGKKVDLKNVDLIYHFVKGSMKEWIIVNSNIIESFTAVSFELKSLLKEQISLLNEKLYIYIERLLHYPDKPSWGLGFYNSVYWRNQYIIPSFNRIISLSKRDVPIVFRRSMKIDFSLNSCF